MAFLLCFCIAKMRPNRGLGLFFIRRKRLYEVFLFCYIQRYPLNRYPTPQTVSMYWMFSGSISILSRMCLMWTVTVDTSP